MDNSIIEPFVKKILEKTESGEYKWETMGSNSFCLLAGDYSFTVRSKRFMIGNMGTPVFRLLFKDKCVYEYVPTIADQLTQFDKLIRKLSDCVEKKYSDQIKSDMEKALNNLNIANSSAKK